MTLKAAEKDFAVWNVLDLSPSKYAKGLMDSQVYLFAPCQLMSQRVIYDLENKKLGVWNFWLFTNVENVPKEKR